MEKPNIIFIRADVSLKLDWGAMGMLLN